MKSNERSIAISYLVVGHEQGVHAFFSQHVQKYASIET